MIDPFELPFEFFQNDVYPVNEYIEQASFFIHKQLDIPLEESKQYVKSTLKDFKIKNPTTKYYYKQDNGDKIIREDKLTDYIKESLNSGDIIVPSFTTYYSPSKQKSIHSDFMDYNTKRRSIHKKAAFKAKQDGDMDKFLYNDVMQKTMKIFNNSLSGAYASKSTVLRNPSAHYTLTSMTRCVSSIGNALTESIVYGNKHFKDYDTVINYITTIITNMKRSDVEYCIHKYKLHIPTPENIMDSILYSTKWYWDDKELENKILDYLKKLDDTERVAVLYTNDLWHLKMYNEELMRNFITKVINNNPEPNNDISIMKNITETMEILVKFICYEDLRGKNVNYDELKDTEIGNRISSVAHNVMKIFTAYSKLFKTFLFTNTLPPTIAYIKDMFRQCIVLSDTDSTCGSYDKWVEWYLGRLSLSEEAIPITGVIMSINSMVVEHGLRILSKNMNLPKERMEILKMKNEFYWPVFISTNKNKHYFANVLVQEGNVFKEPDLEIKGVHLIASAVDQTISKAIHAMIREINTKLTNNEKISLKHYVDYIVSLEEQLLKRIDQGDVSIYKKDSIKEAKAYKLGAELSPYINHLLWKEVFEEKYGSPGEPPYMTIKIPTTLDTKRKMSDWLATVQDEDIRNKLMAFLHKYNKPYFGTFRPPLAIVKSKGLPEEFINCINKERIVLDNLNSAYLVLEALGYYKKNDTIISSIR